MFGGPGAVGPLARRANVCAPQDGRRLGVGGVVTKGRLPVGDGVRAKVAKAGRDVAGGPAGLQARTRMGRGRGVRPERGAVDEPGGGARGPGAERRQPQTTRRPVRFRRSDAAGVRHRVRSVQM